MGWKNPKRKKEYNKEYYQKHKGEILRKQKEYKKNMPRHVKEKIRTYQKSWYQKNIEKIKKRSRERWVKNRKKLNKQRNKYRIELRKKALKRLGNKCVKCGFSDWRALQIDHIYGGGTKERQHVNPRTVCKIIIEKPKEEWENIYQLLCANCNSIKKYERKEVNWKYK